MAKKSVKGYNNILYIDSREPVELQKFLAERCTIPIVRKQLKTGDYVCDDDIFIERKTAEDFARSIIDKRLFKQYRRLIKKKNVYLLISGDFDNIRSKIHKHSLWGARAYIAAHGITVISGIKTSEEMAYTILKLLQFHGKLGPKGLNEI